ncbi:actin-like ATPase domain-containing protein [Xylariaceae sp. FL0662B]|nr:actin-like ATPase domain-containing protein [Xylariaceae sp. FL0662B]
MGRQAKDRRDGSRASPPATPSDPAVAAITGQSQHQPRVAPLQQTGRSPANSIQQRVGQRELGSICEPWFDDSSSSNDYQQRSQDRNKDNESYLRNPVSTPTKKQKSNFTTPRQERAIRRDLVRRQSANEFDFSDVTNMAGQQGKWREDQILVVCPGSQTTMAQLGCSELTPPTHRIPTRMFKDPESGEYTHYRIYKRKKSSTPATTYGDKPGDEWEYVEDRDTIEGAIYPLQGGRIVNMPAFLAFLDHVHSLLTATYHNTPIVLMASPQWTRPDCESIARYIFEKTKTPALCLLNSAIAAQYGLKWPTMTVVDIGFEKVDVTCIYDHNIVSHKDLGYPNPVREISGGEVFTQKLLSLLKNKGFTYEMAEQLKKSPLCEVLPYMADLPDLMELPTDSASPTITQAPSAFAPSAEGPKVVEPANPPTTVDGDVENGNSEGKDGEEGVLDVANIVTSGNTREFLAKREKEKAEKIKSKKQGKGQEADTGATKPARLPNNKRRVNTFHYEELVHEDVEVPISTGAPKAEAPNSGDAPSAENAPVTEETNPEVKPDGNGETNGNNALPAAEAATNTATERRTRRIRKDIEVGLERFLFADRAEIDRITETIYRTIQNIDDVYKRPHCWDNIVFVGNGSRLRGLKENIMQTLIARHLISPSTATIFTSELPSNMATPSGTGSQTPTGSTTGPLPTTSSVNPLLQAATTASLGIPGSAQAPSSNAGDGGSSHHSHGQTPMSIKQAALPTYLAEWTKNGFEEAMFLGSLIAARLAYCIHNLDVQTTEAQRTMSLNRVDYNEHGPKLIRTHSMMGHS